MDEHQKLLQRQQEDKKFVQAVWCVAIAIIVELILFQIKEPYFNIMSTTEGVNQAIFIGNSLRGLRVASLLGFLAGLGWLGHTLYSTKKPIFLPSVLLFFSLFLGAVTHGVLAYGVAGLNVLLMLVPAWAGLGLVFFLYQIEFFIAAFFTSFGGIGLWMYTHTPPVTSETPLDVLQITFYTFLNFSILVILGGFYLVNRAYRAEGILKVKEHNLTLVSDMKDGSSLWLVGLSGLVSLLSLAIGMAFGTGVTYYLVYGLMGWLFVLLIYFTVKMM